MKLWALIAVLALRVVSAQAEITTGQAAEAANKSADKGTSWSSVLDKSTAEASGQTAAKESAEARLLKEHLAEEERAARLANAKAAAAAAAAKLKSGNAADAARAAAAKNGGIKTEEDDLLGSVASTVKDAVRPIKETLDEIRKAKDEAAGAINVPVIDAPKPPEPVAPAVSQDVQFRQRMVSAMLWENFIEEIKPWVIGIGVSALVALGFMQWISSVRSKSRAGSARSSRKRHRRAA